MKRVCDINMCAGCMACVDICPKNAITVQRGILAYNACIDESKCVNCQLCEKVCQTIARPTGSEPIAWLQGWSESAETRSYVSSGGAATELSKAFIKDGGIVFSCVFRNGEFVYERTNDAEDLVKFSGSKYVKSDPSGVYKSVLSELKNGDKVLFIGLPCQVASMRQFVGERYLKQLFLIDLICHGSPSPEVLELYLRSEGRDIRQIEDLRFREKTDFHLFHSKYGFKEAEGVVPEGIQDLYTYVFLNGICYTENCYLCQYASTKRISDITIGDSWGSQLPAEEKKKGISLILCQTDRGLSLLNKTNLHTEKVDIQRSIAANKQLKSPSAKHPKRDQFVETLERTQDFKRTFKRVFPKVYAKYTLKKVLCKVDFIRGGVNETINYRLVIIGKQKA